MKKDSFFVVLGVSFVLTAITACGGDAFTSSSEDSSLITDSGNFDSTPDSSIPDAVETGANETIVPDTFIPDVADTSIPPDSSLPDSLADTSVPPDSETPDTFVPPDTYVADTSVPPDTSLPDTFVPPDTSVVDTYVPPDTSVPDTYVADTSTDTKPDVIKDTGTDSNEGGILCSQSFNAGEYNSPTKIKASGYADITSYLTVSAGQQPQYFYKNPPHIITFPTDGSVKFPFVIVSTANFTISFTLSDLNGTYKKGIFFEANPEVFDLIGNPNDRHGVDYQKNVETYMRCFKHLPPIPNNCPTNIPTNAFIAFGTSTSFSLSYTEFDRVFVAISACNQ